MKDKLIELAITAVAVVAGLIMWLVMLPFLLVRAWVRILSQRESSES